MFLILAELVRSCLKIFVYRILLSTLLANRKV
jgi:hypothetical protein